MKVTIIYLRVKRKNKRRFIVFFFLLVKDGFRSVDLVVYLYFKFFVGGLCGEVRGIYWGFIVRCRGLYS